jgi:hypothetical protein
LRSSIPFTAEKIAVFAPMPTASDSTTPAVHPLACINTGNRGEGLSA